jgi:hypothetical protein
MARLGYAERYDVQQWGATRAAAGDLPQLVRRLILESAPVTKLGFAAAEGVGVGGWDGAARSTADTPHVPAGLSLWELSTDGSPGRKAAEDFNKRLTTPGGSPTTAAVYVAVSTRVWKTRDKFIKAATAVGRWREVRAYALDELHGWLDEAPVTHAWLSELIGLTPHGLKTAERWWEDWSGRTDPALPAAVVLAGRDNEVESIGKVLAGSGRLVTIAAPSREDAFAFVAATAVAAADEDGGALLARMAFIDRVEAWRRLREHRRPLVLVPLNDEIAADMAQGSSHHLLVPAVGAESGDISLGPIDAQQAAAALQAAGLGEEAANEVGQLARMTLIAGRRRIAVNPELHRPEWATGVIQRLLRRVILLGRFSEARDGDRALVEEVLGLGFDTAAEQLAAYATGEDPLLARHGITLAVVSPFDAWLLGRQQMHSEDLEAFKNAALRVLTEVDPAYDLDRDERSLASVRGKVRAYSHDLRRGFATTLAILGGQGDVAIKGAPLTAREWASWIVRDLLEAANKDETCKLWASLDDVMTLIAEAAPYEFVDAVRAGLQGDKPLLAALFEDGGEVSPMFASSAHVPLLWALEIISWSPKHLGAVVDLLARLDEVDPGGNLGNRPLASLMSIFRPRLPQTSAGPERRLDLLDRMRERHRDVAWKLMEKLLLEQGIAMYMSGPRFRDWRPADFGPTVAEFWSATEGIFERVLEDAGADVARLAVLVDGMPNLPPASRSALLERLGELHDELDDAAQATLWSAMRDEAAKNREYADAQWALPEDDVLKLETLVARYQPAAPTVRLRWLFANHVPSIPGVSLGHGLDEYTPRIEDLRTAAAREIVAATDWDEFLAFARDVKLSWFLGPAVANAGDHRYERQFLSLLDSDDHVELNLAASYFARRFRADGWPWLDALLAGELTLCQRARLLRSTDDYPTSWQRAEADGDDVARAYWAEFPAGGHGADFPYVDEAAEKMLAAGALGGALDLLNLYHRGEPTLERAELIARGLELMRENPDRDALQQLSQYGLRNLFEYMERAGFNEARLASLEWSYLAAFGYEAAPPTLSRHLAASPEFFADAISRIYRPGDEDDDEDEAEEAEEVSERDLEVASNAHHLISEWRTLPGRKGDRVDFEVLRSWVDRARELLRESRRLRVGDLQIGKVLAACPPDADAAWPCQEVRDLLELVESEEIERGFEGEIFASLGVTTRGALDGGDQERDRAKRYREQAERFYDRWPRTAKVLNAAAEDFERAARRHDADAERRRTGLE